MDNREQQTNRILQITAETLDLSPSQHKEATDKYRAVGEWLSAEGSKLKQYKPSVYPQGSFAFGTPVKPLGRDEFDIDLVVELSVPDGTPPSELKRMVGVRLAENETYRAILEEMNRCWRLNYVNLHLDSLPARPKGTAGSTAILIPDKELRSYKDSDPKGYTAWFQVQCVVTGMMNAANAQANVEPAPDQQDWREKTPLQVGVQLLKRHRDVYFLTRDHAPISIILTTLAAKAYRHEDSILIAMRGVIDRMPLGIDRIEGKPYVFNPVNSGENFADKWHREPQREKAFFDWHARAKGDLILLEQAVGLPALSQALERFVGKNRADIVLKKYAEGTTTMRGSGLKADLATGLLSSMGGSLGRTVSVPRNTFYGQS
jgi:hypothetical protein